MLGTYLSLGTQSLGTNGVVWILGQPFTMSMLVNGVVYSPPTVRESPQRLRADESVHIGLGMADHGLMMRLIIQPPLVGESHLVGYPTLSAALSLEQVGLFLIVPWWRLGLPSVTQAYRTLVRKDCGVLQIHFALGFRMLYPWGAVCVAHRTLIGQWGGVQTRKSPMSCQVVHVHRMFEIRDEKSKNEARERGPSPYIVVHWP